MQVLSKKSLIAFTVVVGIWSAITLLTNWVAPIFLPSPLDLCHAYIQMADKLPRASAASLFITLSGLGLGLFAGLLLGLLMAYSRDFMEIVGPFMEFTRPVPVLALIPLFLLWFGIGKLPQILLVALGVSVILGISTYEAIQNMPQIYLRAGSNLGADKRTIFKTVIVPYIVPHLAGGVRVAAAAAWGLDVASEFMGTQVGLGYNIVVQQMYLNTAGVIALIIIYSVFAILLDQIIQLLEGKLTHWTERREISFEDVGAKKL